jgi:CheY-like chemotaxis protein
LIRFSFGGITMRTTYPEILLVDHRSDVTSLFERTLRLSSSPARVTRARDAPTAMRRLAGEGGQEGHPLPSIVVLSHDLPDVTGMAFLHLIRQALPDELLPVVMLIDSSASCPPAACAAIGHAVCASTPTTVPMMMDLIDTLHGLVPPPSELLLDECLASPAEMPEAGWEAGDRWERCRPMMVDASYVEGASRTTRPSTRWGRGDAGIEWLQDP